ncbi:ABC transporter ATP-binding protein [Hyalangium minutum]|uniref:Ribose ABC transport system, ATP-binding protein RbsA n=1 Tax=Hyalangium minutum TaxID=394096 RepID=A0A085W756_9BACT|nr:ABC transporter ATP-binding protein [Hyalangium minutum]KFE63519.1 Ribose ABC transport system, ATP-binding protein RbsA [Hyalangium minutum]
MSLDIGAGELLALVGENGAGKSSLMNVLYGLYHPDEGDIVLDGKPIRFKSPRDAIARGIGMVHQHFMLVPTLTVVENVVLGREPQRWGRLDLERAYSEVSATCQRFGFQLDLRARVDTLTVGSQQKVEIVKALHRGAKVLILDEPTAVLTPQESEDLFRVARGLKDQGHTVVFISHKLREVLSVAERIAVMRRGKLVAEVKAKETTASELANLMVGDARTGPAVVEPYHPPTGAVVLSARDLKVGVEDGSTALNGVTLDVHAGEIVGIAGVDGNGQRELAEVLTGLRKLGSGEGSLLGKPLANLNPHEARRRGVSHVPEDRLRRAVVKGMSVEENVALGRQGLPPFAKGPWLDFKGRRERTKKLLGAYDVRPPDPLLAVQALSGGNQQKVVVARELDAEPKFLVVVQPTRGLDISAVAQVHSRLREERARGVGVLLISLDLEEVLTLSDRIYVLFEGRVTGTFTRPEFDEREIGRRMLGAGAGHE